ncbi:MAG: hypothetical protein MJZ68_09605, partial [archaeon]|nr:hypothetical protein [archaeon]
RPGSVLALNRPGSVNGILKDGGIDRSTRDNIASATKRYDLIIGSHSIHRIADLTETLYDLRSKMKEDSMAVFTAPLSKKKNGYMLDETPLGLTELKYLFARIGLKLDLVWNKSIFTREELIFYGISAGESVLVCTIDPSIDQERIGVSFVKAFDLGTVYRDSAIPAPKTAELWFKAAADLAKNLSSEDRMKILWEEGSESSIVQLKDLVDQSVSEGEAVGEYYLGKMYEKGVGVDKDLSAATDHLRIAYQKEPKYAPELSQVLFYRKKRGCISEIVHICMKTSDPRSMYLAYRALSDGEVVPADMGSAMSWLEKSALEGYMDAVHDLTDRLWDEGTPGSISKMVSLCNRHVKDGDRKSIMSIAKAYATGRGVKKDLSKTRVVLQDAFRNGNRWAEKELIDVLWNLGTPDALQEISFIGSPQSTLYVGRAYKVGKCVPKDLVRAVDWYKKARSMGATIEASEYYDLIVGAKLTEEYESAVSALIEASDEGNPKIMYALGKAYRDGIGVPVDLVSAERCFRFAMQAGHKLSINLLFDILWKQKRFDDAGKVALVARDRRLLDKVLDVLNQDVKKNSARIAEYRRSMANLGLVSEDEYFASLWASSSPSALKELSERALSSGSAMSKWYL